MFYQFVCYEGVDVPFFSVTLETEEEVKAEEEKDSSVKDDSTTTPEVRIKQPM